MFDFISKILCIFQDHEFEEKETFFHKEGSEISTVTIYQCSNCGLKKKVIITKEETEDEIIKKENIEFE